MKRIVITGLGAVSPVGNDVPSSWKSLLAGKSGIGPITYFDASKFNSQIAGEVKDFDHTAHFTTKDTRRFARFVQYAVFAAAEAISDSGLDLEKEDKNLLGAIIGSGIGSLKSIEREYEVYLNKGPSKISPFLIPRLITNEAAGQVSIKFGFKGPNFCVTTACASGSHSIGEAFRLLQHGDANAIVAGGTESSITYLGVGGFCSLRALSCRNNEPEKASRPFERDRDGFIIAEGSGLVVLETLEHAQKRNARIYAELVGYGMSADAYHITAPDPQGDGAARAMTTALTDANLKPEDISYINAHGTSTKLNDKIETLAIKKVFGDYAKKIPISSTKSMTGHLLGAGGGFEFIACVLSMRDNMIHPTVNYENPDPECDLDYVPNVSRKHQVDATLSNSLGFGGHNATLVLKRFKE